VSFGDVNLSGYDPYQRSQQCCGDRRCRVANDHETTYANPCCESWLLAAVEGFRSLFLAKSYQVPACQVSVG
jgi:hypothetical protein